MPLIAATVCLLVSQAAPRTKPAASARLVVEAGVVTQSGDVKRVARTPFWLLNADFGAMLVETIGASTSKSVKGNVQIFRLGQQVVAEGLADDTPELRRQVSEAEAFLKKHTVAAATTDFEGKAAFTVRPGRYFLFGAFSIFNDTIVWNMPVTVKAGSTDLILDQSNSARE